MSKPTTIKEVLHELYYAGIEKQYTENRFVDQAIADIQRIIEECKPEVSKLSNAENKLQYEYALGANGAMDMFERNLKARLQ